MKRGIFFLITTLQTFFIIAPRHLYKKSPRRSKGEYPKAQYPKAECLKAEYPKNPKAVLLISRKTGPYFCK